MKGGDTVKNSEDIKRILSEAIEGVSGIYGEKLKSAVLFGSYARGDYNEESDIDIALLLDLERSELQSFKKQLIELSSELDLKYDVLTSFRCIPVSEYSQWKEALPFYANIEKEGVRIA